MNFSLVDGVYLVVGALDGAVYDTNSGNVYSINRDGVNVIRGEKEDHEYWIELERLGLASECVSIRDPEILPKIEPELEFVWFELCLDCNLRCLHCYAKSFSGARSATALKVLSYDEWQNVVRSSYEVGCSKCQFIGGEPFKYRANGRGVLDLAELALDVGFEEVEIFTNATLLTKAKLSRIANLGIRMAVSLYSQDPKIHDAVTQVPGSHRKTVNALTRLAELGVKTRVNTTVCSLNQYTICETYDFVRSLDLIPEQADIVRPSGRGADEAIQPSLEIVVREAMRLEPNFSVTKERLAKYRGGHSCLASKFVVTESGDVLPCIMSRDVIYGNVRNEKLASILDGSVASQVRNSTKEDVLVCQDCEYRFVCRDCRPISTTNPANFVTAPYSRCTYNPYTGEWAAGLWELDGDGIPYYNRSESDVFQRVAVELAENYLMK